MKNKLMNIILVFLFQTSSFFIIIGILISMIFVLKFPSNILGQILPIFIMSIFSTIISSIYMYVLSKEYMIIKIHMTKNWIFFEWIAILINSMNIIFILSFVTIFSNLQIWNTMIAILFIVITFIVSLIAIGFHQYFFYKVKIDFEKRKNGDYGY